MSHIKHSIACGLALLIQFTAVTAYAGKPAAAPAGDPVAGKEKSFLCQGCHGDDGISFEPLIPKLAGQYGHYIEKEVRNYQSGARSHPIMNAMAGTVNSDVDLADIGAYFEKQIKMKGNGSAGNPIGEDIFLHGDTAKQRIACVGCHGVKGKGVSPTTSMFPVLGGQQKEYIRGQLINFRNGSRTNSPGGIMNLMTKALTDAEIEALAQYISVQ
ncbi:MAG: cytochrome c4 [Nitrosomonadales bacterium]|nr:cytochrome c4 [Nitrosomonadales bacterium]